MISLLAPKFAQIDATIATKNAQIAALLTELTELQEYRQQLLSVEQACESALSQVDTALMMLGHVDRAPNRHIQGCSGSQVRERCNWTD
jgi:hypothetical protein